MYYVRRHEGRVETDKLCCEEDSHTHSDAGPNQTGNMDWTWLPLRHEERWNADADSQEDHTQDELETRPCGGLCLRRTGHRPVVPHVALSLLTIDQFAEFHDGWEALLMLLDEGWCNGVKGKVGTGLRGR